MIVAWSTDYILADFVMLSMIATRSTGNFQTYCVILTVIAVWSTDTIQADFVMSIVIDAWSTDPSRFRQTRCDCCIVCRHYSSIFRHVYCATWSTIFKQNPPC